MQDFRRCKLEMCNFFKCVEKNVTFETLYLQYLLHLYTLSTLINKKIYMYVYVYLYVVQAYVHI